MLTSVGFGVLAAVFAGVVVGLWASVTSAPLEATAAISSILGAALGLAAFFGSLLVRAAKAGLVTRVRESAAVIFGGAERAR